jgi:hypothetical protein
VQQGIAMTRLLFMPRAVFEMVLRQCWLQRIACSICKLREYLLALHTAMLH